jgi:hypothetical protein
VGRLGKERNRSWAFSQVGLVPQRPVYSVPRYDPASRSSGGVARFGLRRACVTNGVNRLGKSGDSDVPRVVRSRVTG